MLRWKISKSTASKSHTTLLANSVEHLKQAYSHAYKGQFIYTSSNRLVGQFQ